MFVLFRYECVGDSDGTAHMKACRSTQTHYLDCEPTVFTFIP